jgi:hypothetical protein
MAFRNLTRSLFQFAKRTNTNQRLYSSIQQYRKVQITQRYLPFRTFASVQTNDNAYHDLETFLQKEIQSETSAQKHQSQLPNIPDFQVCFILFLSFFLIIIFFRCKQPVRK